MKKRSKLLSKAFYIIAILLTFGHYNNVYAWTMHPAYIKWDLHYKQQKDRAITIDNWEYSNVNIYIKEVNNYKNPSQEDLLTATSSIKEKTVFINVQAKVPDNIEPGTYKYNIYVTPVESSSSNATTNLQSGAIIPVIINILPTNDSLDTYIKNKLTTSISIQNPKIPILQPYTINIKITNNTPYELNPTAVMKILLESPTFDFFNQRIELNNQSLNPKESHNETIKIKIWNLKTLKFAQAKVKAKIYNGSGEPVGVSTTSIKRPNNILALFLAILIAIISLIIWQIRRFIIKIQKKNRIIPSAKLQSIAKK